MATVENGYCHKLGRKKFHCRRDRMPKKMRRRMPHNEDEVRRYIDNWLKKKFPHFTAKKETRATYVPELGEMKISDAIIKKRPKFIPQRSKKFYSSAAYIYLELEEHRSEKSYCILDLDKINVPLRKIYYYNGPFTVQYWLKIDKDGTPFMISYDDINRIYKKGDIENLGKNFEKSNRFSKKDQRDMIVAARKNKSGNWPSYVIIGWDNIFKEFSKYLS